MIEAKPRLGRPASAALLALLIGNALPETAQAQAPWFMKRLQAGVCVEFLVSPTAAADAMGAGVLPVRIGTRADRHPVLARVAAAEPEYEGWAPAEYCLFLYQEAVVRGQILRVEQGREPLVVGFLAIGAEGLPDGATDYIAEYFSNQGAIRGAMADVGVTVERVVFELKPVPGMETVPDRARFSARHGRSIIQWDGGPGAPRDTVRPRSIRMAGLMGGTTLRGLQISTLPDSAYTPSGNLRVVGSGRIAELLRASPIRLVAEFTRGGDGDWIVR
jgi:hypothetical protein